MSLLFSPPSRATIRIVLTLGILAGVANNVSGQPPRRSGREPQPASPVDEWLTTKDGVSLSCRYFPGTPSPETIPVLLLHGWKGQKGDFEQLARYLQHPRNGGHAVIVPDLRGHGQSTQWTPPGRTEPTTLNANRIRLPQLQQMLEFDLETVKRYLIDRNNREELNIDALVVVGAEMGGVLGLHWAARDWSWPQLPGVKQGQDVKAVVLLTPLVSFKGLLTRPAIEHPALTDHLSYLVTFGQDDGKTASNVRKLESYLRRARGERVSTDDGHAGQRTAFVVKGLETSLQGTDLFKEQQLAVERLIGRFVRDHVAAPMEDHFPWKERRSPLPK